MGWSWEVKGCHDIFVLNSGHIVRALYNKLTRILSHLSYQSYNASYRFSLQLNVKNTEFMTALVLLFMIGWYRQLSQSRTPSKPALTVHLRDVSGL